MVVTPEWVTESLAFLLLVDTTNYIVEKPEEKTEGKGARHEEEGARDEKEPAAEDVKSISQRTTEGEELDAPQDDIKDATESSGDESSSEVDGDGIRAPPPGHRDNWVVAAARVIANIVARGPTQEDAGRQGHHPMGHGVNLCETHGKHGSVPRKAGKSKEVCCIHGSKLYYWTQVAP